MNLFEVAACFLEEFIRLVVVQTAPLPLAIGVRLIEEQSPSHVLYSQIASLGYLPRVFISVLHRESSPEST